MTNNRKTIKGRKNQIQNTIPVKVITHLNI